MAPASRLDDGLMDLFFVRRGAGRMSITKVFDRHTHFVPSAIILALCWACNIGHL